MRMTVALLGVALASACVAEADETGIDWDGDGKADDSSSSLPLIQTNSPFFWAESDYASFLASFQSLSNRIQSTPLEDADRLTARLQGWVDRIDAIVRAEVERSIGAPLVAPKPIVKVLPSGSTLNAWVSPVTVCMGGSVNGAPFPNTQQTLLLNEGAYHGYNTACVRPTSYPGLDAFRQLWDLHKPTCKLSADLTVSGTGCTIESYGEPGELTVYSTSPFIHVTTDFIAISSERSLVSTLAHELGHYYRGHVTDTKIQHYNFWYETEVDRKKIPVPSTLAAELQTAYAEIEKGPQSLQSDVTGRYSARLRTWILQSIAPLLAERTEADFVCRKARDLLGPWTEQMLAGYGIPNDSTTQFLAFERELAACAPLLKMGSEGTATSVSYGTVLMSVSATKLKNVSFPFYATMQNILDNLDVKAKDLDAKEARLLQRVRDNRIGLYTEEQEADNISMLLSVKLGIAPDDVVADWLELSFGIANVLPEPYKTQYLAAAETCKAQLGAGFTTTDANGNKVPVFVPIGDLSEPHHSDCYRTFNLWREQKLKKYQVTTPATFEPGWDELRAYAQQLSDQAKANGY